MRGGKGEIEGEREKVREMASERKIERQRVLAAGER